MRENLANIIFTIEVDEVYFNYSRVVGKFRGI